MAQYDLFCGRLVRLCAPATEDADLMASWSEDPEYQRQLDTDYARPQTAKQIEERFLQPGANEVLFHLHTLTDKRMIGFLALHSIEWNNGAAVLSMGIGDAKYRGKGYGSDALRLGLNYAFSELNLYRVGLDVIASNTRAIRAYEKAGFRLEGAMRAAVYRDGVRVDRLIMGILRPEWELHFSQEGKA